MWGLVLTLGIAAAGCGSGGGTCGNSAACGGDVVGTWTITSSCVTANAGAASTSCPQETVAASNLHVAGSVTYRADGTYSRSSTVSGTIDVTLPPSCLATGGTTTTCAQLNDYFQTNATPGVSLRCSGSTTCTCTETITSQTSTDSGTYTTTSAGLLTDTSTDTTTDQTDYCVKGSTMTQSPHAGSGMMGQPVSGTITLTKS